SGASGSPLSSISAASRSAAPSSSWSGATRGPRGGGVRPAMRTYVRRSGGRHPRGSLLAADGGLERRAGGELRHRRGGDLDLLTRVPRIDAGAGGALRDVELAETG